MDTGATLYLHFPCFDGVASGVLATEFLEIKGWSVTNFIPVNYEIRAEWLQMKLPVCSAVVDFLYHPDAQFWADHHITSFLREDLRVDSNRRRSQWNLYDEHAGSCALLLWENIGQVFTRDVVRFKELTDWADKIDSARYSSVREAILGDAPALRVRASLALKSQNGYCEFLVRALRDRSLADVAQLPEVKNRFEEVRILTELGLNRFRGVARLRSETVIFDLESRKDDIVSRYAPFYFFPEARYSVGIIRQNESVRITGMRNPWLEFPSAPMGVLFAKHGGGGHERVGAVVLNKERAGDAEKVLQEVISDIETEEARAKPHIMQASA